MINRLPTAPLILVLLVLAGCSQQSGSPHSEPSPVARLVSQNHGNATPVPIDLQGLHVRTVPTGFSGGEPSIGMTSKGNLFATAYRPSSPYSSSSIIKSSDHGQSWTEVFNLTRFFSPIPYQFLTNSIIGSADDYLFVDPLTGRIFGVFMFQNNCSKIAWSDDEGTTWTMQPMDCGIPFNDYPKLIAAPNGPDALTPAVDPVYPNVVYYCYHGLFGASCAVSQNGGLSFTYDRTIFPEGVCSRAVGKPAFAPDGTVYVASSGRGTCPAPVVGVTTDNGLTWVVHVGPSTVGADHLTPALTVTPDGTAYMVWRGKDQLQYLVRSDDRFQTWQGPWRISPPGVRSTAFTTMTSGSDGRIAMAYLGTRDTDYDPSHAPNTTRWHLYQTFSLDADAQEPTFTTLQATSDADPVQIGCIWFEGGGNPCRNLLDFIDSVLGPDGRPIVVFSDGCTTHCDGNPGATESDSRSKLVTVAIVESGPSLLT